MNRIFLVTIVIGLIQPAMITGQVVMLNSNQSLPLTANAGNDVTLISGNSVVLGSNPSASYGHGGFLYLWSPAAGLDDPARANPLASPVATTTYILTVTDIQNCSVQDEVTVTVNTSGIELSANSIDFRVYPNPSNGNLILDIKEVPGLLILKIVSSTGMVVFQVNRDTGYFFREELDTRIFAKGNYYVILIHKGKVLTRPVIIN